VPAITHVDGSSRPQLVHRDVSPRYYRLIEKFGEATDVPLVMNTSFNLRGEPIVSAPIDALDTFRKSGIDLLVLENHLVRKPR
jgi:carbamoyltransferase